MKAGVAAVFAAMAAGAHAAHLHHRAHDLFKRSAYDETCVPGCTTIYKTITGAATLIPNPPPSTSVAQSVTPKSTVTKATTTCTEDVQSSSLPVSTPTSAPPVSTSASAPPKDTEVAYQPPKANPTHTTEEAEPTKNVASYALKKPVNNQAPKKAASGSSLEGGNDHFGIAYTPYEPSTGACKSASAVRSDIQSFKNKGFSIVRVYSTDCNTLTTVGEACKELGMDLILGVFVKGSGCSYDTPDIKTQVDAIAAWADSDLVKLIVVGNEAVLNGYCSPSELSELITTVKSKCSSYNGPYTTSETLNVWQQPDVASAICPVIDITGANIHAFFNSAVSAPDAGEFVAGQLEILKGICSGNNVIALESGWPTGGDCNGKACPGKPQQAAAIRSIRQSCGSKTIFFSAFSDKWKNPGEFNCEQTWGSGDLF
ncbi:glycoside hydrolase superfamily [Mariannaea sp. PMI_226]|nr:glycoside hydrolase superfamily [Mariannaea sp. PMI_226]